MRIARRHPERQLLLDMTPMIDIVFQLLIFFLVTAQMVKLSRADIDLPRERGENSQQAEPAGIVINLLQSGELVVSDRTVELDELDAMVRDAIARAPDQSPSGVHLTIRADRRAAATHLNALVERLHRLGVGAARIATSPPRANRRPDE